MKSMKKIIHVMIALIIIFPVVMTFKPEESHAIGPIVRGTSALALEVFEGIAAEAGVEFATESAKERAYKKWNMDIEEKLETMPETDPQRKNLETLVEEMDEINNVEEMSKHRQRSNKKGFGKILLSGAAFLTGADLINQGAGALKEIYESGKRYHSYGTLADIASTPRENGGVTIGPVTSYMGYSFKYDNRGLIFSSPSDSGKYIRFGDYTFLADKQLFMTISHVGDRYSLDSAYYIADDGGLFEMARGVYYTLQTGSSAPEYMGTYEQIPSQEEVPGISPEQGAWVSNPNDEVKKALSGGAYPLDFPNYVPIEIPLPNQQVDEADLNEVRKPIEDFTKYRDADLPADSNPGIDEYPTPIRDPWANPGSVPGAEPGGSPGTEPVPGGEPWEYPEGSKFPDASPTPVPGGTNPGDSEMPSQCSKKPDYDNWQKLGDNFSTKFPFSIPWDVYNAFDAVFGGLTTGSFPEIKLSFLGDTVLTLPSYFDSWFALGRQLVRITFVIGLIYALRKWFGGAG